MFSSDQLNDLARELMNKLEVDHGEVDRHHKDKKSDKIVLSPSQILVILALLAGTLQVTSVLVDRDQKVQLVLAGTLKKNKENELDKIMSQIGHLPFDEVMKGMLGRFK